MYTHIHIYKHYNNITSYFAGEFHPSARGAGDGIPSPRLLFLTHSPTHPPPPGNRLTAVAVSAALHTFCFAHPYTHQLSSFCRLLFYCASAHALATLPAPQISLPSLQRRRRLRITDCRCSLVLARIYRISSRK